MKGNAMLKKRIIAAAAILAAITAPGPAAALVAQPDLFGLDFRFSNPGARANGMGGAFIGLADDASAAYTNPAGLTVLTRSEISVEYKQGTYTTVITDFAPQKYEYDKDLGGMSFVSFAYPQDRATITIFRHNLINTESDFIWHDPPASQFHSQNHVKLNGLTYGIGLGYKLTDSLSLGLTINSTQMEYLASSTGYSEATSALNNSNHPQHVDNISRTTGSDTDEHFTLSLLWNVLDELNLGLVYRQGPKYTFTYNSWDWNNETVSFEQTQPLDQEMKVPDVYGIGLSCNLPFGLTISADAVYVKYSQLYSDLLWEDQIKVTSSTSSSTYNYVKVFQPSNALYMDDEWEYHAGLEYVMELGATPVALRGGYYFRPAAYFKTAGTPPDASPEFMTLDWSKDDDHIYSAGLGFVIGEDVQIDIAGMFGDYTTEGIFSLVYRLR